MPQNQWEQICCKKVDTGITVKYYFGNIYLGNDNNARILFETRCPNNVCKIVGNKYYGKNGTVVSEAQYKEQCGYICKEINGEPTK